MLHIDVYSLILLLSFFHLFICLADLFAIQTHI